MDQNILKLLAGTNARQAQEFILSFGENRFAAWAEANRQASLRAASQRHLPHYRGQLRHQLGETALLKAAQTAKIGCIPIPTVQPGGVFMVARIGRFGLVSLTVPKKKGLPRRAATRYLLSEPNDDLDPQQKLRFMEKSPSRGTMELAYFGCMITYPAYREPETPADMVFAVPNARLTDWIEWIPLTKLHASLQDLVGKDGKDDSSYATPIPDRRIPTFRLPKRDRQVGDEESGE